MRGQQAYVALDHVGGAILGLPGPELPPATRPRAPAVAALILGTLVASAFWWQLPWVPPPWASDVQGVAAFSLADVLALATLGAGVASWGRGRLSVRFAEPRLLLAGAGVATLAWVGSPRAENAALAGAIALHVAVLVGLYLVVARGHVHPRLACWALAGALLPQLVVGIIQVARQSTFPAALLLSWPRDLVPEMSGASVLLRGDGTRWLRAYGPFFHPNIFGGYLAVEVTALLAMVCFDRAVSRSPLRRRALGVLAGLALGCLALSASRGAWAGALASVGALALFCRRRRVPVRVAPDALVAALVAAAVLIALFRPPLFERFVPLGNSLERRSVELRGQELEVAWGLVSEHPALGVGAGNGQIAAARYEGGAFAAEPVHDVPLLMAVELGPLGAAAWLAAAATVLIVTWRHPGPWSATMAAALVATGVAGLFDHYWWSASSARDTVAVLAGCWTSAIRPLPCRRGQTPAPACNEPPYYSPGCVT